MCGLAGIVTFEESSIDVSAILRMREAMHLRGPDGAGLWIDPDGGFGLAHRRLAIIDLSERGAQPMATRDGRFHVAFNGEIYNYPELRRWCESRGATFVSNSDTEVLLHLYALEGEEFVQRLRGMFAFALWDRRERTLLLVRDPFGIKPLYYANDGKRFQFASQVKALLAGGLVDSRQDAAGVVSFFIWGFITEPHTLYGAIRALPAGSLMRVQSGRRPVVRQYHNPLASLCHDERVADSDGALRAAALDSVRHHLLSDVPMGQFLSAGIDSATMFALASECTDSSSIQGITLGFQEFAGSENDEVPLARRCAEWYGGHHSVQIIGRNAFESRRAKIMEAMDQPTFDGVNTYLVSEVAADSGLKVAISGLGGDELFGGYSSFRQVPLLAKWFEGVPGRLGSASRRVVAKFLPRNISPKYAGLLEYGNSIEGAYLLRRALFMPWELSKVLEPEVASTGLRELGLREMLTNIVDGIRDPYRQVMALEYDVYLKNCLLRDSDWAGMANSLEIRTPLVDIELFTKVNALRRTDGAPLSKYDLAATPMRPLPREIVNRRKSGFQVPVQRWLERDSTSVAERGLRGWVRYLAKQFEIDGLQLTPALKVTSGGGA